MLLSEFDSFVSITKCENERDSLHDRKGHSIVEKNIVSLRRLFAKKKNVLIDFHFTPHNRFARGGLKTQHFVVYAQFLSSAEFFFIRVSCPFWLIPQAVF